MAIRAAALIAFVLGAIAGSPIQGELVIVKEGTGLYHRAGCDVIRDGKDVLAMGRGQAESRGYKAHADCDPSRQPPPATPGEARAGAKPGAKPPAAVFVFVDSAGKLYHREGCARLGKDRKKVALDATTANKYWPCGVCKPPVRPRKNKKPWSA